MPEAPVTDPARATFLHDVIDGLSQPDKRLPYKYLYDDRGSALFDRITELPEYYPTRTELAILKDHATDMAEAIGPRAALIEFGSGSSVKTRCLLDALPDLAAYVPVDISEEHLHATARQLQEDYPDLPIFPLAADYTAPLAVPDLPERRRRVVYFPGSTIGNFESEEAEAFLRRTARIAGPDGGLLIGVDLVKDSETLERAYDDAEGVTAAFNLNLLARINRELDADFDPDAFEHRAVWNPDEARVELYLVSTCAQSVSLNEHTFHFEEGEPIHTEHSHKYTPESFARMAERAGFSLRRQWRDADDLFSVLYLDVSP